MSTLEGTCLELEALPFDQYQRYRLVADLLDQVAPTESLRLLDVGGRTALLRAFRPGDRVELVDVEASQVPGLVLGDGAALPFREGVFDAVCAFDTLEHVPPAGRDAFVRECHRVASRWVILAGPYAAPRVDEAEERLMDFLEHKLRLRHRYLAEHRDNGLPDRQRTEALLRELGGRVASFGHGELGRWLALMCVELYLDHDPMLRPIAPRFYRFYNRVLFESDTGPEVYRHAIVAAKGEAPLPKGFGDDLLGGGSPRLPAEGQEVLTRLAAELLAFDRDRDALTPELERLREIIASLESDLAGHKARLADRSSDLEAHGAALRELRATYEEAREEHARERAALQADLDEHARALAEARRLHESTLAEAADQEARFEQRLEEHQAVIATLEEDLAGHRAALTSLRQELQEARAAQDEQMRARSEDAANFARDLEALREHQQSLEGELARTQEAAAAIQRELLDARQDIAGLLAQLTQRGQELEVLRAALRDRWGNLRRAFGPKRPL